MVERTVLTTLLFSLSSLCTGPSVIHTSVTVTDGRRGRSRVLRPGSDWGSPLLPVVAPRREPGLGVEGLGVDEWEGKGSERTEKKKKISPSQNETVGRTSRHHGSTK